MPIHSHMEERYCPECDQNVGIEYTRMENGIVVKRCVSKACLIHCRSDIQIFDNQSYNCKNMQSCYLMSAE